MLLPSLSDEARIRLTKVSEDGASIVNGGWEDDARGNHRDGEDPAVRSNPVPPSQTNKSRGW